MSLIWRIRSSHVRPFFPRFRLRLAAPLVTRQSQLDALYAAHLDTTERHSLVIQDRLTNDARIATWRGDLSAELGPNVLSSTVLARLDAFCADTKHDLAHRRVDQEEASQALLDIFVTGETPRHVAEKVEIEYESKMDALDEALEKHERWTKMMRQQIEGARQEDTSYLSLLLVALLEMEALASKQSCDWYEEYPISIWRTLQSQLDHLSEMLSKLHSDARDNAMRSYTRSLERQNDFEPSELFHNVEAFIRAVNEDHARLMEQYHLAAKMFEDRKQAFRDEILEIGDNDPGQVVPEFLAVIRLGNSAVRQFKWWNAQY